MFILTYSLIPVTLAFVAGITWAKFASVPEAFSWMLIILLATRLTLGIRRQSSLFTPYLILPLFFLLGGVHATPFLHSPENPQHIYNLLEERQEAVITGVLLTAPETGRERTNFLIQGEHLQFQDHALLISGLVKITMADPPADDIAPGDRIMARAKLSRPRSYRVPGAFDYKSFLSYQGIWAIGWVKSANLVTKVHSIPKEHFFKKIPFVAEQARQRISRFIDTTLSPRTSGIYKAILIGDRSAIPPELTEQYKSTGSIHLLAISGMHMGLLAFCLTTLISFFVRRSETLLLRWPLKKITSVLCLLPLGGYAFIAGFHPPVFRALLMAYIFMAAIVLNRQWSITNNIAIAALIMLTINPVELYTASFQLSFAAVCAIALIYQKLSDLCQLDDLLAFNKTDSTKTTVPKKIFHFSLASILLSLTATIGTAPLLAFHFNRISLISPVTTLLIEPFLCLWSLLLGLLACLFLPLPNIAAVIFKTGAIGITVSNWITFQLSKIPSASIWLATPPWQAILLYYGFLLLLVWYLGNKVSPQRSNSLPTEKNHPFFFKKKTLLSIFCLSAIALVLLCQSNIKNIPEAEGTIISVLDVGQGQAVVIEFPNGKTFLIDGGKSQGQKKSTFNIGEALISPFLWKKGITKIDEIIISHPHADHYNGIPFLLDHFKPTKIWLSSSQKGEPDFNKLIAKANDLKIPLQIPTVNEYIFKENEYSLQALTGRQPDNTDIKTTWEDIEIKKGENNRGLVIKLQDGERSVLFPGDIESQAEDALVLQDAPINTDIFLAPHHGSITSSSTIFIKKMAAKQVIISAGFNQWGRFPNMEVVARYKEAGLKILTTGQSGTIFLKIAGNTITIETSEKKWVKDLREGNYRL